MNAAKLEAFAGLEDASLRASSLTARACRVAMREKGRFAIALSGGSTPGRYFELLAGEDLPWVYGHVFWADERLVPPDSPESNYRLAREHLLSRIPIPDANIHPMRGDGSRQDEAARACEAELRAFFGDAPPEFDALHLGLGGDGHTASLFPGQPALTERERWVVPVEYAGASPPVPRLTLTLPVINAARLVFFLLNGEDKAALAREIVEGRGEGYPAALVRPRLNPVWLAGGAAPSGGRRPLGLLDPRGA